MPYFRNPDTGVVVEADLAPCETSARPSYDYWDGDTWRPLADAALQEAEDMGVPVRIRHGSEIPWPETTKDEYQAYLAQKLSEAGDR